MISAQLSGFGHKYQANREWLCYSYYVTLPVRLTKTHGSVAQKTWSM